MAWIKKFNDFKLFQPTEEEAAEAQSKLPERLEINRRFLADNPQRSTCNMSISGSFISAHAPDYIGVPTLHWSVEDWHNEFQAMKKNGLDTVILQAAAWKELEECYFPSKTLNVFKQFDVIAPLIEAAQSEKMTIYLGGLGTISGWDMQNKEKRR